MKFQELLAAKQINWERVKLIRHNLTNEVVAANYEQGYLELYQSVQSTTRFKNCDMVISFFRDRGNKWRFSRLLPGRRFQTLSPHPISR